MVSRGVRGEDKESMPDGDKHSSTLSGDGVDNRRHYVIVSYLTDRLVGDLLEEACPEERLI